MADDSIILHGSAVALGGKALLALGASGSGKSALCLALMASGALLVADDRVRLWRAGEGEGKRLLADAPAPLHGRIEARGVGLLCAAAAGPTPVALIVDLDMAEDRRLPPWRSRELLEVTLPLVLGPAGPHLHAALRQYLLAGRAD